MFPKGWQAQRIEKEFSRGGVQGIALKELAQALWGSFVLFFQCDQHGIEGTKSWGTQHVGLWNQDVLFPQELGPEVLSDALRQRRSGARTKCFRHSQHMVRIVVEDDVGIAFRDVRRQSCVGPCVGPVPLAAVVEGGEEDEGGNALGDLAEGGGVKKGGEHVGSFTWLRFRSRRALLVVLYCWACCEIGSRLAE